MNIQWRSRYREKMNKLTEKKKEKILLIINEYICIPLCLNKKKQDEKTSNAKQRGREK